MGLFTKKTPTVIRKGQATEERNVRTVKGEEVTVRRFVEADGQTPAATKAKTRKAKNSPRKTKGGKKPK